MLWEPISKTELLTLVQEQGRELPQELAVLFDQIKIPVDEIDCIRQGSQKLERVFIIAKKENCLLIYDDVEDEFTIALTEPDTITTLKGWLLCGDLYYALIQINKDYMQGTPCWPLSV